MKINTAITLLAALLVLACSQVPENTPLNKSHSEYLELLQGKWKLESEYRMTATGKIDRSSFLDQHTVLDGGERIITESTKDEITTEYTWNQVSGDEYTCEHPDESGKGTWNFTSSYDKASNHSVAIMTFNNGPAYGEYRSWFSDSDTCHVSVTYYDENHKVFSTGTILSKRIK